MNATRRSLASLDVLPGDPHAFPASAKRVSDGATARLAGCTRLRSVFGPGPLLRGQPSFWPTRRRGGSRAKCARPVSWPRITNAKAV